MCNKFGSLRKALPTQGDLAIVAAAVDIIISGTTEQHSGIMYADCNVLFDL